MPPRRRRAKPSKRIAAIVCTYNRYDTLAGTLTHLAKQSLPRSEYEIIVVDNSSDIAAQRRFWKRRKESLGDTLRIETEPGLARARNIGVEIATAPLVAFIDDDATPVPEWLESLAGVFDEEENAGVVGGPVVPIWPASPPKWLHRWLAGFYTIVDLGDRRRALTGNEWLAGTNMAFRRDLLFETGGFDENLGRRGTKLLSNEDLEAVQRIRAAGRDIVFEPSAIVHHLVDPERVSQAWLRRRVTWQALSNALGPGFDGKAKGRDHWDTIARYALRVPPEMRSIRGLFMDTDDPETLHRQSEAISALMMLMLYDGSDPEAGQ